MTLAPFSRSQESSDCWKMACLHSISRINGWILTKLVHLYCCDMEKNWLDFGILTPFSRSHKGLDCWKMVYLHPISWMNGWSLTKLAQLYCCDMKKKLFDFGDPDSIFKGSDCWKMASLHSISRMNRWVLTKLVQLYCWDRDKNWLHFGDLNPIFKVTGLVAGQGSDHWKMACLHPTSRMNGWILTKLVHLYCCDMEKNWLDLVTLTPFSRPHKGKELMDFDETYTTILSWHEKELVGFRWPWPYFQGHRRAQIFGKWLFCTLSLEWLDGFWPNLYSYIVEIGTRTD